MLKNFITNSYYSKFPLLLLKKMKQLHKLTAAVYIAVYSLQKRHEYPMKNVVTNVQYYIEDIE
jgi:hypothetical protein